MMAGANARFYPIQVNSGQSESLTKWHCPCTCGYPGCAAWRFYCPAGRLPFADTDAAEKLYIGRDPRSDFVDLFLCCNQCLSVYLLQILIHISHAKFINLGWKAARDGTNPRSLGPGYRPPPQPARPAPGRPVARRDLAMLFDSNSIVVVMLKIAA